MMGKITFTRSQPWSDRLGKHTVIDVLDGGKKIGEISGESGAAIPMMQYSVECGTRFKPFSTFYLAEAKAKVRQLLGEQAP